ncbi:MAG: DUF177 domain-containing protein [Dehalococcoidia bacterium]
MLYNLSQFLRGVVGETRQFPITGDIEPIDGSGKSVPVVGDVELVRTNQGVLARVRAVLSSTEECSRCLKPIANQIEVAFEEIYYPTSDPITGHPLPSPPEPDAYTIDHNHMLDLGEAIREYAVMARPLQPLCREDCAGLCPTCGIDRNTTSCACTQSAADPRWAMLWQVTPQE